MQYWKIKVNKSSNVNNAYTEVQSLAFIYKIYENGLSNKIPHGAGDMCRAISVAPQNSVGIYMCHF